MDIERTIEILLQNQARFQAMLEAETERAKAETERARSESQRMALDMAQLKDQMPASARFCKTPR